MSESGIKQDRRSQPRRRTPANRVSWTRENADRVCTGWVSDVATSSVAFVTATRDQPAPGEALELTLGATGPHPQYRHVRVARLAPFDSRFTLVACRDAVGSIG